MYYYSSKIVFLARSLRNLCIYSTLKLIDVNQKQKPVIAK